MWITVLRTVSGVIQAWKQTKKSNEKQRKKEEGKSINLFEFRTLSNIPLWVMEGHTVVVLVYCGLEYEIHRQNG